ncbi:unnamed protein product [Rotaria sp. Silwood2]|nr:unnamed protein product [Rotaria sp. Silwood2]CAF2826913.1 unnamed protein product [Rotaria sp. Silwood2]
MTQNLFKNRNGVSWNTIAIPSEVDRISVQHVLEYSFLNLKLKNSFVTKANLDSIKQLFKSWKKCIYALALIIFKLIPDRDVKSKQLAIDIQLGILAELLSTFRLHLSDNHARVLGLPLNVL